jgi:hypothetical protein
MSHFIGYSDLEKLLNRINTGEHVYLLSIEEPGQPTQHGISVSTTRVIVQFIEGDHVYYWQWKLGHIQMLAGKPFSPEQAERTVERGESAIAHLRERLERDGIGVAEALVASPQDYKYLDGSAPSWLKYDEATNRFIPV